MYLDAGGKRYLLAIFGLVLLLGTSSALAARPFVTDDARLTNAGNCQLESWARIYPESRELWALPACNPTGNLEFTFGAGGAHTHGQPASSDFVFQLKTLLKPLERNDWGVGLAAGKVQHPGVNPGPNQLGNHYAYVPLSMSLADDSIIIHGNLGWLHDKESRKESMTWGLGSEVVMNPRLLGILEVFGDERARPFAQIGVRYSIVPNLFQIDATLGRQLDGIREHRWISFGIRYTP